MVDVVDVVGGWVVEQVAQVHKRGLVFSCSLLDTQGPTAFHGLAGGSGWCCCC